MKKHSKFTISASSWKSYENCSLKYFYSKILKIPEPPNQGAISGSCVHEVFECLLLERRRTRTHHLIKSQNFDVWPAIPRLIRKLMKKYGALESNYQLICDFIWTGLNMDFLADGGVIRGIEHEFTLHNENPEYSVKGYIDVLLLYKEKAIARDFKTQSKKFEGKELIHNIQGLMYSLYLYKTFPDLEPATDFLMLRFPDSPFLFKPTEKQLQEFEYELATVYSKMKNFTEKNKFDHPAAFMPYAKVGEGFSGRIMCGRAKFKGELTKDKSKTLYHCPYRFEVKYFKLCDDDGNLIKTAFTEEELKKDKKEGMYILPAIHHGCEAFKR